MSKPHADQDLVGLVEAAYGVQFDSAATSQQTKSDKESTTVKTKQKPSALGFSQYADPNTGLQAVQKTTPTSFSIGIAGTNSPSWNVPSLKSMYTDMSSWGNFGKGQAQGAEYEKMKEAIKDALEAGKSVKIGGHSMGGMVAERLAHEAVQEMKDEGRPINGTVEVEGYNSPGMKDKLGPNEEENAEHIKTDQFRVSGDPVSPIGTQTGATHKLEPVYDNRSRVHPDDEENATAASVPTPKVSHSLDTLAESNKRAIAAHRQKLGATDDTGLIGKPPAPGSNAAIVAARIAAAARAWQRQNNAENLAAIDDAGLIGKPPAKKDDLSLPEKIEANRARARLERAVKARRAQKAIDARRAKNDAAVDKVKARFDKKLGVAATDDAGLIGKPPTRLRAKEEDAYAFEDRRARRSLLGGADEPLGGTVSKRSGLPSEPAASEAAQSSSRARRDRNDEGADRFDLGSYGDRFEKAEKAIARARDMEAFGWTWEGDDDHERSGGHDNDSGSGLGSNPSANDAATGIGDVDHEENDHFDKTDDVWHQGGLITDRVAASDDPAFGVTVKEGEFALSPKAVEMVGADTLATINAEGATGRGRSLKVKLEDVLGRGRPTGEAALRHAMKAPAYWNPRHPDHAQVRHRVGLGFRLLHPARPFDDGDPKTQGADMPARLPEGTFILNARAARALGPALLARIEALGSGWAGDQDAARRVRRAIGR